MNAPEPQKGATILHQARSNRVRPESRLATKKIKFGTLVLLLWIPCYY